MSWQSLINDSETDEVLLTLVRLSHADWVDDIRRVSDVVDHEVGGEVYIASDQNVSLPDQADGRPPSMRWTITDIDSDILTQLRLASSAVDIEVSWVLASDVETVHAGPFQAEIWAHSGSPGMISAELTLYPVLDEVANVTQRFSKADFPGLF